MNKNNLLILNLCFFLTFFFHSTFFLYIFFLLYFRSHFLGIKRTLVFTQ